MRIYHNVPALNAWRNMGVNQSQLSKSLERLSSGLRINRAADDAAGLTISEKMRGQISGLTMAAKNAQDGISLIQTAEGALNETHSILQRMRELSVEAANDTLTSQDRQEIQKEIDQLIDEIDRIGNTTEFNTKKLLNGSVAQTLTDDSSYFDAVEATSDTKDGVYDISFTQVARRAVLDDSHGFQGITATTTIKINGESITLKGGDTLDVVISKINVATDKTNVVASRGGQGGLVLRSTEYGSKNSVTIQGDATVLYNLGLAGTETKTVTTLSDAGLDTVGSINRSAAQGDGLTMTQTTQGDDAQGLKVEMNVTELAASLSISDPTPGTAGAARKYYLNGLEVGASTISDASLASNIASAANALGLNFSTNGGAFIFTSKDTGLEVQVSYVVTSGASIVSQSVDMGDIQGVTHTFTGATVSASISAGSGTVASMVINGAVVTGTAGASAADQASVIAGKINADASKYGVVARASGSVLVLRSLDAGEGAQIKISSQLGTKFLEGTYTGTEDTEGPTGHVTVNNDSTLKFHIGANKDQTMQMGINDMRSDAIGTNVSGNRFENVKDLKYDGVTTREAAEDAIELIDKAIQQVSSERAKLGAYQNRLEHTIANLNVASENMTASESRIRDVDMAREMMKFTKYQILNQSSTAMLAQANTLPQGVLTLLR